MTKLKVDSWNHRNEVGVDWVLDNERHATLLGLSSNETETVQPTLVSGRKSGGDSLQIATTRQDVLERRHSG